MFAAKNELFTRPSGGYRISNSLRFRSSASAYLSRTPASSGNRQTWTWSGWVKRGLLTVAANSLYMFDASASGIVENPIVYNSTDNIELWAWNGSGYDYRIITNATFRDTSAWYHVVVSVDTTQATSSNRIKVYVNGVLQSLSTATYPSQNYNTAINFTNAHNIGRSVATSARFFDGYLAEVNFIDGQALDPTSFGAYDTTTGVWGPKKYTGSYSGTNSFYLNFSDNSGATSTTIGKDSSGKGNNWTPNNISVTSGTTYDSMIDTPTPYDDTTVYGRGNYPVLNRLVPSSTSGTISNGNLDISQTGDQSVSATMYLPTSGKIYFEFTINTLAASNTGFGIFAGNSWVFGLPASSLYRILSGSSDISITGGGTPAAGQIIKVAYDITNGKIWYGRDTLWFSNAGNTTSDPSTGSNPSFTGLYVTQDNTNAIQIVQTGGGAGSCTGSINFGQRPFTYTPPSGFSALNTQNLPTPTIKNGAQYMAAVTFAGNSSSSNTITTSSTNSGSNPLGTSFQPDLIWIKNRNNTSNYNHTVVDAVRGGSLYLETNNTNADQAVSVISAFNSNGFTLGTSSIQVNGSSNNYIGWQWKGGNGSVSNTSGSITSTVSANVSAGFSIVTYTGTQTSAGNGTIGHGLGVAPSLVISKARSTTSRWVVQHISLGTNEYLEFNTTAAAANSSTVGAGALPKPTSSVFYGSWLQGLNINGDTFVAYCFAPVAGYSAFGSYTGNGSADGPFMYTGFRPRWVLLKRTNDISSWVMYDTSRDTYNAGGLVIYADSSNAENDIRPRIDILSNGFKLRNANEPNWSSATVIYAAFAENPFKYSLAR